MEKFVEKRFLIYFALTALFLFTVPLAVFRGQETPGSSAECSSYVFSGAVTVESLQEQLDGQGVGQRLTVWKPDGTRRLSGAIETGDILEVSDVKGNIQSRVAAVVQSSPDSGGQSSRKPSSQDSGSSGISGTERAGYYVYDRPVTVEALKEQVSGKLEAESEKLEVVAPSGRKRESGSVCTGDSVRIVDAQGKTESSVTAVIPGDLTRCGEATRKSGALLYSYLTGKGVLEGDLLVAADIDGNGTVNTADLLKLKKELSGNS